jgi:mRNA interferase YafQ
MFEFEYTNQFKRDIKSIKKRSIKDFDLLLDFLLALQSSGVSGVDIKYKAHKLIGTYKNNWEAHIKPDLLIIWFEVTEDKQILLIRVGSHSDLF